MTLSRSPCTAVNPLGPKGGLCRDALAQARRLATSRLYGALLSQVLARAGELLDDIDEVLVALDPRRDHAAFASAAELHRQLEQLQAQVPRCQRFARRDG